MRGTDTKARVRMLGEAFKVIFHSFHTPTTDSLVLPPPALPPLQSKLSFAFDITIDIISAIISCRTFPVEMRANIYLPKELDIQTVFAADFQVAPLSPYN
ncbi:hypothetical protein STEG23_020811 [Scotinomys teguina]